MDPYLRIAMSRLSKKTGALLIYIANKFDSAFEYEELEERFRESDRFSLQSGFEQLLCKGYIKKVKSGKYLLLTKKLRSFYGFY